MGDIHLMQDDEIRVLYYAPSGRFYEISDAIYQRMESYLHHPIDNQSVQSTLDFLEQEKTHALKKSSSNTIPKRLSRVNFLATQTCNLRCRYCSVNHGYFTESEDLVMSFQVYKDSLQYLFDKYPEGIKSVVFFGGEPLLGFDQIRAFVPYCLEECRKRGVEPPSFGVITNGTVLNETMIAFFNEFRVSLTISLDGPKGLNDIARVAPGGWSVYDKIAANLEWINRHRNVPLGLEITLNKQHVLAYQEGKATEWLTTLQKLGADCFVAKPVESKDDFLRLSYEDETAYRAMYRELVRFGFENLSQEQSFFHSIFDIIQDLAKGHIGMQFCGVGVRFLNISVKGDILPCYLFYGNDNYLMSNIYLRNDDTYHTIQQRFADDSVKRPEECRTCWARNLCTEWCPGYGYTRDLGKTTLTPPRCWTIQTMVETAILHLTRLRREPDRYKMFLQHLSKIGQKHR